MTDLPTDEQSQDRDQSDFEDARADGDLLEAVRFVSAVQSPAGPTLCAFGTVFALLAVGTASCAGGNHCGWLILVRKQVVAVGAFRAGGLLLVEGGLAGCCGSSTSLQGRSVSAFDAVARATDTSDLYGGIGVGHHALCGSSASEALAVRAAACDAHLIELNTAFLVRPGGTGRATVAVAGNTALQLWS